MKEPKINVQSRREFLAATAALLATATLPVFAGQRNSSGIVPAKLSTAPNYYCTWAAQNYMYGWGMDHLNPAVLEVSVGAILASSFGISESILLNADSGAGFTGFAERFHPMARQELYFLIDDGWEEGGSATFELDRAKFPSFAHQPPSARLASLNQAIKAKGWQSLALWCRDTPSGEGCETFVSWSKAAQIPYWKIDGGDLDGSVRRACTKLDAQITLEHIHGDGPVVGDWRKDGRFGRQAWDSERQRILRNADVYRTYDTTTPLGVASTLDRAAEMLRGAAGHKEATALLNLEDEVVIAAVLGCTMGVMRHPMRGMRPSGDPDIMHPAVRSLKQRMDEVARATRWHRIAPPFAAGTGGIELDENILTDDWRFSPGEAAMSEIIGQIAYQGAPARIARNSSLPDVSIEGVAPFIFCSRHPNGAVAIGSSERVSTDTGATFPRAHVTWDLGDASGPVGIFGHFASLTLRFNRNIDERGIWAQDLLSKEARDIRSDVRTNGNTLTLSGGLIDHVGLEAATPGDLSQPGLVLDL